VDSFLPQTARVLLGILAAAFLLAVVVVALLYVEDVVASINQDQEAARYQREYASLRRFEGNRIAYTEVLNALYAHSLPERPVIVVPQAWWNQHNPDTGTLAAANRLLRFPLPIAAIRADFFPGHPAIDETNVVFSPASTCGIWDGIQYNAALHESMFRETSEWLANQSRANSGLVYTGHIIRNESGVPYAIVFVYTP
jgi:hypothetical protein